MKRSTKYPGTKVALACASFLALAGVTASVAANHAASLADAATVRFEAQVNDTTGGQTSGSTTNETASPPVHQRAPVTQTRGS